MSTFTANSKINNDEGDNDGVMIVRLKPRLIDQEEVSRQPYEGYWNGNYWVYTYPSASPSASPTISAAPTISPTSNSTPIVRTNITDTQWGWVWPRPSYFGKDGTFEASYSRAWFFALIIWVASLLLPKNVRRKLRLIPAKRYKKSNRDYRPKTKTVILSSNQSVSQCSSSNYPSSSSRSETSSLLEEKASKQRDYLLQRDHHSMRQSSSNIIGQQQHSLHSSSSEYDEEVVFSDVNIANSSVPGSMTYPPPYSEIRMDDTSSSVVSSSIAPTSTIIHTINADGSEEESPNHPDPNFVPPYTVVWKSTLKSLEDPGVRCMAHGVTTKPRTVWLQYFPERQTLTWKTEMCTETNDDVWGPLHQLALEQILYIDVGSHTPALENESPDLTLSLLTRQGSLDLQTRTSMERNALVSCFCILLDRTHGSGWRHLSHTI